MRRGFTIYIGCVGALALAAIAWPGLVLVGLFMGVIPGLLIALSPSLFVYSLSWWGMRTLLLKLRAWVPISSIGAPSQVVHILSVAIVVACAVAIPQLSDTRANRAAQVLQAGDRAPAEAVRLPPVVVLILEGNYDWSARKPFCETLCLRLLFNSAVDRVIAVDPVHDNATSAFWIERHDHCPAAVRFGFGVQWNDIPFVRGDTWEDRIRARTARGECLVAGEGRPEEAAMTISYRTVEKGVSAFERPWALELGPPAVHRLEISEASGETVYRRTEVVTERLASPLRIETAAGLLTTVTYAGWARAKSTSAPIGVHGRDVLPQLLGGALRKPDVDISPGRSQ
jgi:hypothetical protein